MKFYQKLLTGLIASLSLTTFTFKPTQVWSQALDRREIRELARSITVKIVDTETSSNGSGVIFNRQNNVYSVLTNQHVAGSSSKYEIHTPDGQKHQISFKEEIPGLDLMVVQFESNNDYQIAELGDSEEIAPLELVYVAGFPAIQADLDIVDGKIRSIRQDVLQNPQKKQGYALVYTNETLPGSSGGAVLDEQGYLVGINGEAERDIMSGRDISRGIPINLFISLSFNYLPEEEFELDEAPEEDLDEESELEIYEEEAEEEEDDDDAEIAYVPTLTGNSNYSLAYNIALDRDDEEGDDIRSVAITPNGQTIVTGGEDDRLKIWNGVTGKLEKTLPGHEGGVKAVAISADGRTIVSGGEDNQVKIWNGYTGNLERTLTGHEEQVNSVAINLNGDIIVSGGGDRRVRVWNRYTGNLERTLEGHEEEIKSVAISADGNTIVSGGQDKQVKIWNWRSWELRNAKEEHEEEVRTVAISPDGNTIVSGSGDRTIKIWDAMGNLQHTLRGHSSKVDSVAISSDGQSIISGSRDRTIKIWNLQTKALEQNLTTDRSDEINSIAASANNQIVVSGGTDSTLAIWYRQQ
ncbi:MAG: trypsin-like peptidase domain-containing protein [Pleurocapsa sp. MO_226.B13]|nr:trypsin-like peptidase domain-containing protein [Pleurocapsa sp. MO_226.B13]